MNRRLATPGLGLALAVSLAFMALPAHSATPETDAERLAQDLRSRGWTLRWQDGSSGRNLQRMVSVPRPPRPAAKPITPLEARIVTADFLRQHAPLVFGRDSVRLFDGRGEADPSRELRVAHEVSSRFGQHLTLDQYVDGIRVVGAHLKINVRLDGEITSLTSSYRANLPTALPAPSVTATDALKIARDRLQPRGPERAPAKTELVLLIHERARVAWQTETLLWAPHGDWQMMIDANTGEIIDLQNKLIHGKPIESAPDVTPHVERVAEPTTAAPRGEIGKRAQGNGYVLPANPLNGQPARYSLRDGDPVDVYRENLTLDRLDGSGLVRGDYADVMNSDAPRANEPSLVFEFSADVTNGNFHEVNAYWHIDTFQDYVQTSLGIPNANNRRIPVFVHQGEDDNSDYSPSQGRIRFGDGGVDDSEDGEIVLHEYGHAVHDNIVPGFSYAFLETGAISEGFGDYLAATFGDNALVGEWDATSYNPGPPPFLRRTNTFKHYPEDLTGSPHADGEIISGAWWDLRTALGAVLADQLIIESFFLTSTSASFQEFADATVQVDMALHGGAHTTEIFAAYGDRGIPPTYTLDLFHTPLGDDGSVDGPYSVEATVAHTSPITNPGAAKIYWRLEGETAFNTAPMTEGATDTFTGSIPGPGAEAVIEYYIEITDDASISATHPTDAPSTLHSFYVGTDIQPPVLVHGPLGSQALLNWPPAVRANISDNVGVFVAFVSWDINGLFQPQFTLVPQGGELYAADFPILAGSVNVGDTFTYSITALDTASPANTTMVGPYTFQVVNTKGIVLIMDDNAPTKAPATAMANASALTTASAMATALSDAGYLVTLEDAASFDDTTWGDYTLLVSSSGTRSDPVGDTGYRQALEAYVAGGGKLLIEGGEVGYAATSNPAYPSFAANILHASAWLSDQAGDLDAAPGQSTHRLLLSPNALPLSLTVVNSGNPAEQDAMVPDTSAQLILRTAGFPNAGGLIVFDDNPAPQSAQIVYYAFAYDQLDPDAAAQLLENTADFLVASEGLPNSSITGRVLLKNEDDHSGTTIVSQPQGVMTTTAADGSYSLGSLYANTHTVTVKGPPGFETVHQVVSLGESEQATDVDFTLRPAVSLASCFQTPTPIPDAVAAVPGSLTTKITVSEAGEVSVITVSVDIQHGWQSDLTVELISPEGTTVRLHNRSGGDQDDIVTSYDDVTPADGPGRMSDFLEENPVGDWTLLVIDGGPGDAGTLNEWCLNLVVVKEIVPVAVSGLHARNAGDGIELSWQSQAGFGLHLWRTQLDASEGARRITDEPLVASGGAMLFLDTADDIEPGSELRYDLELVYGDGRREMTAQSTVISYAPTRRFALDQNVPNPFNPTTKITFTLPERGATSLRIYDVAGRLVRTLRQEELAAGRHEVVWDGTDSRGGRVSSGTYFYRVQSGRLTASKAMVLVK